MQLQGEVLGTANFSRFGRSVVVPLTALVIGAVVLVMGFVLVTAQQQDDAALKASLRLAQTALETKKQDVARNLKDYAFWQDAFDNLHTKVNVEWASTDGNVGANIYNSLGYDLAFVLSPDRKTVYAVRDGKPVELDGLAEMPGVAALLPEAIKGGPAAVGFMPSGTDLVIAGASAILPPNAADAPAPDARSVMVFAKKIDGKFLDQMSHNYLLSGLHLGGGTKRDGHATLPLTQVDGTPLGQLTWAPDEPGHDVLRSVLPPLVAVVGGLMVFAALVLRNARRSAAEIHQSSETIKSYALSLQSSEARFRDVAEASSDWIWETDPDLKLTYVSARISEVTSLGAEELVGVPLCEFFVSDTTSDGWSQLRSQITQRATFRDLRCCYDSKDSEQRICRIAGRPIVDEHGLFLGYRGTAADVTTEILAQERANHLALHDPLTSLPNRVLLRERLSVALESVRRERARIAVLCLDLDHFKDVNDTLGHSTGDILLQHLAHRLQAQVRGMDTIARLGGDEFAIVQVGLDGPADAEALSRRIIEDLRESFLIDGSEIHVGVSIGIAISPDDGVTEDQLLKHADLALYRAKQAGRGVYRFFEAAMDTELQARKALEQELRRALIKNELQLFYQPLVSVGEQELKGVEALLRWFHPVRGLVSPADFIPLAEDTGLIVPIGEWVLRTACRQATAWPGLLVAVNVSAVQFKHREFVESVRQILEETGLEPGRLELEITEGVLLYDSMAALGILTALKQLGVRIAMDDFGTGYSSLGYLNSFPFDKIKIDRSFITNVADQEKSSAIVRSVISLGQSLCMVTTAEGVETTQQLDFLKAEGCDQVQGYIFGKPLASDHLTELLQCGPAERPFHYDAARLDDAPAAARLSNPAKSRSRASARRRRAMLATLAERNNLRRGIAFAQAQGQALNLRLSFAFPTTNGATVAESRWTSLRHAVAGWMGADPSEGIRPDVLFAWARQGTAEAGAEQAHLLVHCASADIAARVRREAKRWARSAGGTFEASRLDWVRLKGKRGHVCGKLDDVASLFGLSLVDAQALSAGGRALACGLTENLDAPARERWRIQRRRDAAARRSSAAFKEVVERCDTLARIMKSTSTETIAA